MKKVKGMPITGTNTAMAPKAPVRSDAAHPSRDAEKKVMQPPSPFANPTSTAQSKPGAKAPGGISTLEPKIQSGLKRSTVGAKALPTGGAIGQRKMPNQSGQIGGRMGYPPPSRKAGSNDSGYPVKRNARFYGE